MALPPSGPISIAQIRDEFGGTNPASLSQYYAGGGLVPAGTTGAQGPIPSSGPISLSNFYSASNSFSITLPGGVDVDVRNAAISQGWNQSSNLIVNVTSMIVASSTGGAALRFNGSYPAGVRLNNGSNIVGRGGNGGAEGTGGAPAGPAITLSPGTILTLNNVGIIAGGGGGGGGGAGFKFKVYTPGGGGGGGRSTDQYIAAGGGTSAGGNPGGNGTFAGAGGGGQGAGPGGPGGNWGDNGAAGQPSDQAGGGPAGAGARAILKNGGDVTIIAAGQIFGGIG